MPSSNWRKRPLLVAVFLVTMSANLASAACVGDCDGTNEVTIDEILVGVNIALDYAPTSSCLAFDANGDGSVTVDELLLAVNHALTGCGPAAPTVFYDRTDHRATVPFPDDFWLTSDASTPTGVRLNVPAPPNPADVHGIFTALLRETDKLDGFSPIAHFVVELSDAPDPTSLPQTPAESLDPRASIGLFDITTGSATLGQRIPFKVQIRDDHNVLGLLSHTLLIFPSIPLEPGSRYGFVITRRVRAGSQQPFAPSSFLRAALTAPVAAEPEAITRVRALADEVLTAVAPYLSPPIGAEDVALVLRISVRTTDDLPNDFLAIREQVVAAPPPAFTITSVDGDPPDSDVAAIVTGEWQDPDWRNGLYFARDAQGLPVQQKTNTVGFKLALPKAALNGPVPVTMYQHGNPGSAEREVPSEARQSLAKAGFAVIGFTDNLNREVSMGNPDEVAAVTAQVTAIFFAIVADRRVPDFWAELHGEQLAFLRMIQSMGSLDVLPVDHPDGVPDLDVSAPLTYVGISQGANYAPGLLPYAPEIRAAAVVVGGSRLAEVLIYQQPDAFLTQLGMVFPNMTAADIWVGLSLFQHIFDRQDEHNHARFIYRQRLNIGGTTRKASILQIEGLNDSMVPNHASESLAWALGPIPHLRPVQRAVPFLQVVDGPVFANIDAETTAAFFQYVPVGVAGIDPTPGCVVLSPTSAHEGHFCAQGAAESLHQRVVFFQTAVQNGVPTIINPFAP